MIIIESRQSLHLLAPGVHAEGFKVRRGTNRFASLPHWVRPRLQNFIDAGLMTIDEEVEPAKRASDTSPSPPPDDDAPPADDAPAEARKPRRR